MPVSRPPSAFQTSGKASRWLWLPPFSNLGLSGLGGESCPAQPQPSPSRVWPTRYPGVGRQPASSSWQALSSASAGDPPSRGLSGRPGGLSAPVWLWGCRGAPATGVIGIPAGLSRGGATETRSRDRVQPAAGSSGAVPHRVPPWDRGSRVGWTPAYLAGGQGRRREATAGRGSARGGPEPSAGGGAGDWGGCGSRGRSAQLLLRRRFLPSRRASRVAKRGRAEAPLPLRVSQVSSRRRRRQGRGRIPRLRASPAPRPGPT